MECTVDIWLNFLRTPRTGAAAERGFDMGRETPVAGKGFDRGGETPAVGRGF